MQTKVFITITMVISTVVDDVCIFVVSSADLGSLDIVWSIIVEGNFISHNIDGNISTWKQEVKMMRGAVGDTILGEEKKKKAVEGNGPTWQLDHRKIHPFRGMTIDEHHVMMESRLDDRLMEDRSAAPFTASLIPIQIKICQRRMI